MNNKLFNDIIKSYNTVITADCCYCSKEIKIPINHRIKNGWTKLAVCQHCGEVCFVSYTKMDWPRVTHLELVSDINDAKYVKNAD